MITIVFWSLAYVFTRLSLQYFSPFSLGFLIAGEYPDKATIIGGSIFLLGVLIFNFGGRFVDT